MCAQEIVGFAMIVTAAALYLWLNWMQRKHDEERITCHICGYPSRRIDCREYAPGKWVCDYCEGKSDHPHDIT